MSNVLTDYELRDELKKVVPGKTGIRLPENSLVQLQIKRLNLSGYEVIVDPRLYSGHEKYLFISIGGSEQLRMSKMISDLRQDIANGYCE